MLPGLTPAHTRRSFHSAGSPESRGARLSIERVAPTTDDFILSETGLWLLPTDVAEQDVAKSIARADYLATQLENDDTAVGWQKKFRRLARLLGRSTVGEQGCIENGLRGKQTPSGVTVELAEFEMGVPTHNTADEVRHLSLCGNEDCYNSRHHNLDFGGSRRDLERVELNPHWYLLTVLSRLSGVISYLQSISHSASSMIFSVRTIHLCPIKIQF